MPQTFDLFGDPVPENHGRRGRPAHIPTQENRRKVSMLLALGWSDERIAAVLLVTLPTLRKHYFSELKVRLVARDRLDATRAMQLWREAEKGNVAAHREFERMLERNDAMRAQAGFTPAEDEDEVTPAKLGKKDQAQRDAANAGAGTGWGKDLIQTEH